VFPEWGSSKSTLFIIAFLVGVLIYAISNTGTGSAKQRLIGAAIALLNSFLLAASAMGIDVVTR
jgi:hypothetical protein